MVKAAPAIPTPKFREIVRNLLAKTTAREVNWVRKPLKSDIPVTAYEVILPESKILLTYSIPRAEPNVITLLLQNPDGVTVDSWAIDEPDYDPYVDRIEQVDPEGDWQLLSSLFAEVHRAITGWDKVLRDVENALASPGPIGAKPPIPSGAGTVSGVGSLSGAGFAGSPQ
jgi:hypothetical protein